MGRGRAGERTGRWGEGEGDMHMSTTAHICTTGALHSLLIPTHYINTTRTHTHTHTHTHPGSSSESGRSQRRVRSKCGCTRPNAE